MASAAKLTAIETNLGAYFRDHRDDIFADMLIGLEPLLNDQALVDAARLAQGQVATLATERDNLQQQLDALGRKPAHSGSTAAPVAGGAAEAEAPADAKPRYVDDGTLATAKKYGMRTDHWNMG